MIASRFRPNLATGILINVEYFCFYMLSNCYNQMAIKQPASAADCSIDFYRMHMNLSILMVIAPLSINFNQPIDSFIDETDAAFTIFLINININIKWKGKRNMFQFRLLSAIEIEAIFSVIFFFCEIQTS